MGEELQEHAGEVWNRTCDALATGLPSEARTGDVMMMLRAVDFDGRVHNDGLLHHVEENERYFDLPQEQVADQLEAALLAQLEEDPAFSPL